MNGADDRPDVATDPSDVDWFVFQRLQEVSAAVRINFLRLIAIVVFFGLLLAIYFSDEPTAAQTAYLWSAIRICGAWLFLCAAVALALYMKIFPPVFKFVTTLCDAALLTAIISVGGAAESSLVIVFFLIIASTYLRLDSVLVLFGTLACVLGYLTLVWNTTGYWERPEGGNFPYLEVSRIVVGLLIMGLIGWQLCRNSRAALESSLWFARNAEAE